MSDRWEPEVTLEVVWLLCTFGSLAFLKLKAALFPNLFNLQLKGGLDGDVGEHKQTQGFQWIRKKPSISLNLHLMLLFCIHPHADHGIL